MPRPPSRRRSLLAVLALSAIAMAGCGATEADEATGPCTAEEGATVVVSVPAFEFDPDPVELDRCDAVVWQNDHDQAHTSTGDGAQRWSTGNLAPGERSAPVRFEEPGAHAYLCALHPFMTGTVEVA